jgi:acetyltransferase-like isoleucine patch superfamily enzyme
MDPLAKNDVPTSLDALDINSKFARVRDGSLAADATEDSTHLPASSSRGYFHETDSTVGVPWIPAKSGHVTNFIGAYSYINGGGYMRENVLIGRYVSIGRRVTIAAGGHSMRALSTSPSVRGIPPRPYTASEAAKAHRYKKTAPYTVIESDVWIGDGAVILPGIRLAVGSVVGANAVVVRDTSPYEIVGGVPAKTIGSRFDETTVSALMATQWWEYDRETINRFPCSNVFEFMETFARDLPARTRFVTFLRP